MTDDTAGTPPTRSDATNTDSSPEVDVVLLVDAAGHVLSWPTAAEALTGRTATQMISAPLTKLAVGDDAALEACLQDDLRHAREHGPRKRRYLCAPDGPRREVDVVLHHLRRLDGDALYAAALRLAPCHARQRSSTENADRALVTGTIVHDFNNLIVLIALCCEQLRQSSLNDTQQTALEHISLAAERASALARQVLAQNRRKDPDDPVVIDVGQAIDDLRGLLQRAAGDAIEVTLDLEREPTPVNIDESELTQILLNLALNARDAMPDGGVLSITTRAMADATGGSTASGSVRIEVADTGVGMSPEIKARVFEPYFTTKVSSAGTGYGLTSVRSLVERRSGSINVDSEIGRGTTFTILLPLSDARPTAPVTASSSPIHARPGETILVIDDEPVVREIVASLLRQLGYDTVEAPSPADAIAIAGSRRIDLLVTDLLMSDLSGADLAQRVGEISTPTRILFISGDTSQMAVPSVRPGTPVAFLQKPFDREALGRKVRALLDAGSGVS